MTPPSTDVDLLDAFRGCLLGGFVGDALGAPVEGLSPGRLRREFGTVREMIAGRRGRVGRYTDDTQMTIAVAEWLLEDPSWDPASLARKLVESYDPSRGYGRGTTNVIRRLRNGESFETAADSVFPRGSFGNGAALRVGPCALLLHHDRDRLDRLVETSAIVTHSHPLGVAGAVAQARAIALALETRNEALDPIAFAVAVRSTLPSVEFRRKLRAVEECLERGATPDTVRARLGTNSTALGSVGTALFAFLAHAASFEEALVYAVNLGGDTDSIGAMTGALAGARLGASAIPERWRRALEEGEKGASYVEELAERLLERHRELREPERARPGRSTHRSGR
jgi:poly(ADP-ribose) glycohydrolase ARH3